MSKCFAFLPHVSVQEGQEIQVGPFVLWRNSPTEWLKRFNVDNSWFFEMYRNSKGDPVGADASILSKPDYADAPYEEFRDAVYCLSSAVWVLRTGASDAWVFERWLIDVPTPPDQWYQRESKFSRNITSANYDRVYPTPYTHRIALSRYHYQEAIAHFTQELEKPRKESMLTAFSHFHLARFDTPYFTSPGDAVESMWSGFESLLEIDNFRTSPTSDKAGESERLTKTCLLILALQAEFKKFEGHWRQELWNGIEAWVSQFYKERNHHAHGVRGDRAAQTIEPYKLSAFSVAINIARAILELRWRGANSLFAVNVAQQLSSLFLFMPLIERTVSRLKKSDREVWYPGNESKGNLLTAGILSEFERDLVDLVNLRSASMQFRNHAHLAQARKKMGLVLSAWVTDLLKQPPQDVDLDAVAGVPSTITALQADQKPGNEIDTELANDLSNWRAAEIESYGPGASKEPRLLLRGKIPIWLWVKAYIKLTELWLETSAKQFAPLTQPSPTPAPSPPHPDKTAAPSSADDSSAAPAPPSDTEKAPTP